MSSRSDHSTRGPVGTLDARRGYQAVPGCLRPHLLRASRVSLSTGRASTLLRRADDQITLTTGLTVDQVSQSVAATMFNDAERRSYLDLFDTEKLRRRYREGRRWTVGHFRVVELGTVRPVRVAINVRPNERDELEAHVFTSLSDQRASWEAHTDVSVMLDPRTQLYLRDYARLLIASVLARADGSTLSAACAIRVLGGESAPEGLARDLSCAIGVFLDTDCVAYRHDERTIGVLFPTLRSAADLRRRLVDALAAARESLAAGRGDDALSRVRCVAETVYAASDRLEFARALSRAISLADRHEREGGDLVGAPVPQLCPDGGEEGEKDSDRAASDVDLLPPRELRAFARIASAMLDAESPRQAVGAALGDLGAYYGARRVYVVMATSDDNLMSVPFEWVDSASTSIRGRFSGAPVSRFPFIMRNVDAPEPVFVSKPRLPMPHRDHERAGETWHFCIVPVSHTNERSLALCVDDPTRNYESWGLARCVAAHALHEWRLPSREPRREPLDAPDGLGGMPGLRELEHAMSEGGSGAWSSLGALVVSVAEVGALVSRRGFSHALALYEAIRRTLEQDFGASSVFRTADAEFVALAPNSSYQFFVRRCARSRAALVAEHAGEARFGSAWADRASDAWNVVDEARVIAAHDVGAAPPDASDERPLGIDELPTRVPARDQAVERRFTVYLQPKIDMRSGRLVGAEALARVVGEDGSAGSPTHEIDRLEESGEISKLDYFVFDRTLALMSSWARRRLAALPVSTNFSRATLVNPTSLASVLAIMSRYPGVPAELTEMEVTETAIDLGGTTLTELVERFRALGMRVALDDFGSHYSSVSVLANVPFDTVKLDRSLVSGVPGNDVSCAFVRGIAQICADRNMTCVAEGVETPEQARALVAEGCAVCQGFYYDKPMPPELFEEKYLRRGRR